MNNYSYFKKALAALSAMLFAIFILPAASVPATDVIPPAEAVEINISAASGKACGNLLDNSYNTTVSFSADDTITITSTQNMYGIYVEWGAPTDPWTLSYDGKTVSAGENGFLHEYIEIEEGTTSCTISLSKSEVICDISAYSSGILPSDVQVWEPSCDAADILVFSTHADDEILFLGGILATYGGQQGLNVQVVYMNQYWDGQKIREHEKLDGLWESGITHYPLNGSFTDLYADDLAAAHRIYNYDEVVSFVTEQIRRFKPLVCVTQDLNGEYGHGGHQLLAKAVCESVDSSNNAAFCAESANTYGTWDVPKTYLHLYAENKITMDLRVPLTNMGGRTAVEVAADAYKKHVSQQWCWFYVSDEYEYSCADFGLYRTTVGTDTGNDLLEHVTTYEEQARLAKEKAEAESRAAAEAESASIAKEKAEAESRSAAEAENANQSADGRSGTVKVIIIVVIAVAATGILLMLAARRPKKKRR